MGKMNNKYPLQFHEALTLAEEEGRTIQSTQGCINRVKNGIMEVQLSNGSWLPTEWSLQQFMKREWRVLDKIESLDMVCMWGKDIDTGRIYPIGSIKNLEKLVGKTTKMILQELP